MSIYDRLLLGKIESAKGTDSVPTKAADAIRVRSFDVVVDSAKIERQVVKDTWGSLPHDIGKQMMTLTVEFELRGSGAAGTAPDWGVIARCAGLSETVAASTSVTYDLSTDGNEGTTFYAYKDGLGWQFVGSAGTITGQYTIGEHVICTAEIKATYKAPTVVALPTAATFQSSQPIEFSSASTANDGAVIKCGSLSFDYGINVAEHYTTGEHVFEISAAQPTVTLSKDSVSTVAEWTALTAATTTTLSVVANGGAGNIVTLTAVDMRRDSVGYGERDNRDIHDVTYSCYESTGDDQLTIALT